MGSSWTGSSTGLVAFRAGLKTIGQLRAVLLRAGAGRVRRRRRGAPHQRRRPVCRTGAGGWEHVPLEAEGRRPWQRCVERHRQAAERERELRRGRCGIGRGQQQQHGEHGPGRRPLCTASAPVRCVGPYALRRPLCTASAPVHCVGPCAHLLDPPPGAPGRR